MDRESARRSLEELALAQHAVVARWQLLERGIPGTTVDSYLRTRRLVRVRRGVYALGHRMLTREGRWMAAVLAPGPDTVLSAAHAAAHWDLMDATGGWIHVARLNRHGRKTGKGIVVHRPDLLWEDEVAVHRGIPVTTVARTILDVAADLRVRRLEQVVRRAARTRRFDLVTQHALIDRHPGHRGARPLRSLLDSLVGRGTEDLRSKLELLFLELCDEHRLPAPVVNGHVEEIRVDFHWSHARLVIETDGFDWHAMPTTFEADRANDQRLVLAGWRVVRITRRQLREDRERVRAMVLSLLTAGRAD